MYYSNECTSKCNANNRQYPENVYLSLCNELKKLYAFIPDKIRPALSRTNSATNVPVSGMVATKRAWVPLRTQHNAVVYLSDVQ